MAMKKAKEGGAPKASGTGKRAAPRRKAPPVVVGIGASAGGLEALEGFLSKVPPDSGVAFVIIQHLDPTRKGLMVELLQRSTGMKVVQVTDRMKVAAGRVYVIPPNKDMSILHGALHLLDPVIPRGLRLPIDFFFRALADDRQEQSIGVILSGMGSDGTLGLRAIKEKAGAAFVQAPESAKYDSMPRSAVDAGVADVVAPVEELPGRIMAYLRHFPFRKLPKAPLEGRAQSALEKVFILLRSHTGHDFSLYKRSTIYRRIERRMGIHQIGRIADYVRLLQENPQEANLLFKELLIGVTSFFRDPEAWESLKAQVLPSLLGGRPAGGTIRAWVPGCSTGEEAYSLAMVFRDAVEQVKPPGPMSLQIFATDLDRDAIEKARAGFYPDNIAADVPPEFLRRFFVKEENGYRVGKAIREMVVFAPQNLTMDPPFTKLDLLTCRNLLIYLSPELQNKLLPLFHYSLNPGGVLFLGSAEGVGAFTHLFAPLEAKARLFRRLETGLQPEPVEFPASFASTGRGAGKTAPRAPKQRPNVGALTERILLQHHTPAAVLVNPKGDIVYISGKTGAFLEPAAGKANWNVLAMAREGLRYELTGAFSMAVKEGKTVKLRGVQSGTGGSPQAVDVTVQPLDEPEALRGMVLVAFADAPAAPAPKAPGKGGRGSARDGRSARFERELESARDEVKTTREAMQTAQEELRSANEELQSTNEELQSTNEELTTSKEELQSLNEELQTVNQELQAKVDELSGANNDMRNLLNSTDIATLFLDGSLLVRRFTTQAAQIFKLIPGDVGRPITDVASSLVYPDLAYDSQEVLRTLVLVEKPVAARGGRWFKVRIMPYRTLDNRIDGVVITFTDITESKRLEVALRKKQSSMEKRLLVQDAEPAGAGKQPQEAARRRKASKSTEAFRRDSKAGEKTP